MLGRLLTADLRRRRAVSASLLALVTLAATLVATGVGLILRTAAAIDGLWAAAQPPDAVQMTTGEVDPQAIDKWVATRSDVADHQVITTLPVAGASLTIDGRSQAESVLEPAFVTPSPRFDFLVDAQGRPVDPAPGEVVLPVYYLDMGVAQVGDKVEVASAAGPVHLTVRDFARDAQMNPSLVTSKRLVVHADDFTRLHGQLGPTEHLVEFRLHPGHSAKALLDDYAAAGLPATGIALDGSVFWLMNGLTTMLVAVVALLAALLLVAAAVVALRYALLAAVEADVRQVATLQAIGAPTRFVSRLYLTKYAALIGAGALLGCLASLPLTRAMDRTVLLYLGQPPFTWSQVWGPVGVVALLGLLVLATCWLALRQLRKLSVVEALRRGTLAKVRVRRSRSRLVRSRLSVPTWLGLRAALARGSGLLVAILATALTIMVVPANVASTFAHPDFASYIGVGAGADVRLDVREGDVDFAALTEQLSADPQVTKMAALVTRQYEMLSSDGQWETVVVEGGEHATFPLRYQSGGAPAAPTEIALSANQADAVGAEVGQPVQLRAVQTGPAEPPASTLTVSGIYQDLTNGGRTAKGEPSVAAPPVWQLAYVALAADVDPATWAAQVRADHPSIKVTEIARYADQTLGATTRQLGVVATVACGAALALAFLITALFTVLSVARSRADIALQRALGMRRRDIAGQFLLRAGVLALVGIGGGQLVSLTLGQRAFAALLGSFGAPGVRFLPTAWVVWGALPAALLLTTLAAVGLALHPVRTSKLLGEE